MMAWRIVSEVFLYFAAAVLFPVDLPVWVVLAVTALCALGGAAADRLRDRGARRCLAALIPPLALLAGLSSQNLIFCALPAGYTVLLILSGRLFVNHTDYAKCFRVSAVAALLLCVFASTRGGRGWLSACYLALYFLFGVFFLHRLRLGYGVSRKNLARDFALIAAVPAVALAIGGMLYGGLTPLAWVLGMIARGAALLLRVVSDAMGMLMRGFGEPSQTQPTEATTLPSTWPTEGGQEQPSPSEWSDFPIPDMVWSIVLYAAIAAAAVLAVYWIAKHLRKPVDPRARRTWVEENGTVTQIPESPQQIQSNRRKIRGIYGRYLALLRSRGYRRLSQDTSLDVLESTRGLSSDEACEELRKLYILARYRTGEKVTSVHVQRAKLLLKQIRDGLIAQ